MDKWIATVNGLRIGERVYAAGEVLELGQGVEAPDGWLPMVLRGPGGEVSTGPWFRCVSECVRHGKLFKPGMIWDRPYFKEPPPEGGLFEKLEGVE